MAAKKQAAKKKAAKSKNIKMKDKMYRKDDVVRVRGPFDAEILDVEQESREDDEQNQYFVTMRVKEAVNSSLMQAVLKTDEL